MAHTAKAVVVVLDRFGASVVVAAAVEAVDACADVDVVRAALVVAFVRDSAVVVVMLWPRHCTCAVCSVYFPFGHARHDVKFVCAE